MGALFMRKYNTAATCDGITLRTFGTGDIRANPTLASGDVTISKDGGAFANLTTLPSASPASGKSIRMSLSATEASCARAVILFVDQTSPKEWDDFEVVIETFGNASAQFPPDFSDSVRQGMTALPNAAAGANTGLPVVGTQVPNATAGASGGLFIAGTNAATTVNFTGTLSGNVGGVATGGITAGSFAASAITSTVLANDAITAAKIANDAITAAKIADGAIDGDTFAAGAIDSTALADSAITSAKFAAGAIDSTAVADTLTVNITGSLSGSVGSVTGSVGSVTGSVGSVTGSVGSVTGSVNGSVAGNVGGKVLGGGVAEITGVGVMATVSGSVTVSGTVAANVTQWSGTAVATPDTAGYPKVTIKSGTGTGELNLASGNIIGMSTLSLFDVELALEAYGAIQPTVAGRQLNVATDGTITGMSTLDSGDITSVLSSYGVATASDVSGALDDYGALKPTVPGRTLDVASTGEAGLDFDNIHQATVATALNNITIENVMDVARVDEMTQNALKDFFLVNSSTTYSSAVAGSVVKEIADNAAGSGGGGTTDWTATERNQIRHRLGIDGTAAAPSATPSLSTLTAAQVNTEVDTGLADVGLTTTVTGRIDAAISTRATPAQVGTEVDAALADVGLTSIITGRIDATISSRATPAQVNTECDTALVDAGVTTTRTGYLDKLNISGNVASSAEVTAIQNNTRVVRVVPEMIELPDSGSTTYRIELYLYDAVGNMEAPDSAPTITLVNQAGTDRSARLDSTTMALISTGRYRANYTTLSSDPVEQLLWTFNVVEGGATRGYGNTSQIVDAVAVDFTSADRAKLDALHDVRLTAVRANNLDNLDATISSRSTVTTAQVNSEVDAALADIRLDELLAADSDIDGATPPAVGSVYFELMTKTTGSFTYNQTTDSLEAIRDRGDAGWTTATGFSTLTQADIRTAVGLASANLDTQLAAIDADTSATVLVTAKLDTALVQDGAVYQFTVNALENAPSSGGGGTTDWTNLEREQIRYRLGIDGSTTAPTTNTPNLGTLTANVVQISGDSVAADNLEAGLDGTGATWTGNMVGSIQGNLAGSVTGNVAGNVQGSVLGNVNGSVGQIGTGGITAASFAANAITLTAVDNSVINAIRSGLALEATLNSVGTLVTATHAVVVGKLDGMLQLDVAVWQWTANALELVPSGFSAADRTKLNTLHDDFEGMVEPDGPVKRYTINSLEMAPAGGGTVAEVSFAGGDVVFR